MIPALLLAAASPQAVDLGRQLASAGMLANLAPLKTTSEIEEMVAAHRELSETDKVAFRASAKATAERLRTRIIEAEGDAYAAALSVEDLKALVAFQSSDVAKRQRAASAQVIAQTMKTLGNIDFKGEAASDFCKTSGKLCTTK